MAATLLAQLPATVTGGWFRQHSRPYAAVWPQGWFFFDRTADLDSLTAYHVGRDGRTEAAADQLAMSRQDEWGWGRISQVRLEKTLGLASGVPDRYWTNCSRPLSSACLAAARTYPASPLAACGLTALVRRAPTALSVTPSALPEPGSVVLVSRPCTH